MSSRQRWMLDRNTNPELPAMWTVRSIPCQLQQFADVQSWSDARHPGHPHLDEANANALGTLALLDFG